MLIDFRFVMNPVIIALQDRAQACIDSFLLDDAIFFAERLVSYVSLLTC